MTASLQQAPLDHRTARLTRLYVCALTAVAILSITGQLLVQHALQRQRGDSTVVNIAGRQRMLSQRLTKAALAWHYSTDEKTRRSRAAEITETLELWKRSHVGLQQGAAELQLTANSSPVVRAQFAQLEPIFAQMVAAAEQMTTAVDQVTQQQSLNTLLEREPEFLAAMDAVVFQLDREAQARVARLQRIEWLLLSLTLVVLLSEGWLVFRPAVQRIRVAAHELVESREQLRLAKEAAESASEQKSRFLATLSHELRNPLHAILGNTELTLDSLLTNRQRGFVATIDESARSLLGLVNDLLDLACIQAGKLRVQVGACDLQPLVERCISMVEPLAQSKGLRLSAQLPKDRLLIQADSLRVQQVLLNLLGNAVKFTDRGEIKLLFTRLAPTNCLRLEVVDTGPGIPPHLQQTIFAAFTQVDATTRREFAGVGLGLAISSGLVSLMNGRIGVESELGKGSCFWVELPLAEAAEHSQEVTPVSPTHRLEISRRVLIAEDDAVNRRLLTDFLQLLGQETLVAADGLEALHKYRDESCDLVLLDWHMPQLDGLDLARQIRAWEQANQLPSVPLIAISAAGAIADEEQAQKAGIDLFLVKPVSLEQLRQALATVLRRENSDPRWERTLARMQGKRELFRDVAQIFLEQLPADLAQLSTQVARREFDRVARAAHLLRGQAANFDAAELIDATRELEQAARHEMPAPCDAELRRVCSAATELQDALRMAANR